jgi:uncharacterized protein (DUF4213/DUF364 family)
MWALYDALIGEIPPEITVDEALRGGHWTMVRCGNSAGLAMTVGGPLGESRPRTLPEDCRGLALRELAEAVKSWNFAEAALGMAAINAFWNSPEREAAALSLNRGESRAFEAWRERVRGKKAAVVGHFRHLEKTLGDVCELSILEKNPQPGDYPDSACEFILSQQDFVFATGVTLVNKTLPRLLELSRSTGIILAGPTVPLAPPLFAWGVKDLQGFVVTDPELCRAAITAGTSHCEAPREATVFAAGKRVSLVPSELSSLTPPL